MCVNKKIPTIVLDIDDTIIDFLHYLCLLYNKKHGSTISDSDITTWDFKNIKIEDSQGNVTRGRQLRKFFNEYEGSGLYCILPPIKESLLGISLIKKLGYKIVLLTARPEKFKKDTELSLLSHDIPYDKLIFNSEKDKEINKLSKKHRIVAFVDDSAPNVEAVAATDKVDMVCIINRPYNTSLELPEGINRISGLLELVRQLPPVEE